MRQKIVVVVKEEEEERVLHDPEDTFSLKRLLRFCGPGLVSRMSSCSNCLVLTRV